MQRATEDDVLGVIQTALGDKHGAVTVLSGMETVETWDSLAHLGILAALDTKFDGKIAGIEEMATVASVQQILEVLKSHALI
jgi:acyl carrier protein